MSSFKPGNFVVLYQLDSIVSSSIVEVLKDPIVRLKLAMSKCRGKCYDGAAIMAGIWNEIAAQMCVEEPLALYSHCYGNALNTLLWQCTEFGNKWHYKVKQDSLWCFRCCVWDYKISEILSRTWGPFHQTKQEITPETPGFCTLRSTCWTVHATSLKSVIDHYLVFQALWEEVKDTVTNSEI